MLHGSGPDAQNGVSGTNGVQVGTIPVGCVWRDAGSFLFSIILEIGDFCLRSIEHLMCLKRWAGGDGGAAQCWSTCLAQMSPSVASPAPNTTTRVIIVIIMMVIVIKFSLRLDV